MLSAPGSAGLRFAVVGLGYWGPNLLRALSELEPVDIAWMCDLDRERLARYQRRYPGVKATTDLDEVLADDEVDAVLIATPVFSHFELAAQCLRAGKHTFVEKPLAPSVDEADELLHLARSLDLVLMCGHTFLYSPPVLAAKELIRSGELGDIFFISSSRVNLGLHQRDVGVVWDLGPHDFSILRHWLDEVPTSLRAVGRDSIVPNIADVAFVTLTFPSGVIANVELSWLSPSKLRRTVVVGSRKMVMYEDGDVEPLKVFDHGVIYEDPETFGEYQLSYRTGDIVAPKLDTHEPLGAELSHFARAVGTGASMEDNMVLARDVVRITEAADRSLKEGGAEVVLGTPQLFGSLRPRQFDPLGSLTPGSR
jgi:predicted dehydrogenase